MGKRRDRTQPSAPSKTTEGNVPDGREQQSHSRYSDSERTSVESVGLRNHKPHSEGSLLTPGPPSSFPRPQLSTPKQAPPAPNCCFTALSQQLTAHATAKQILRVTKTSQCATERPRRLKITHRQQFSCTLLPGVHNIPLYNLLSKEKGKCPSFIPSFLLSASVNSSFDGI